MIKKSVSLWLPRFEAVDQGIITEEDSDPVEVVYMLLSIFLQCHCVNLSGWICILQCRNLWLHNGPDKL